MSVNKPLPVTIQETQNGVIARDAGGKFTKGTKPKNVITSENAREMQRKGVLAKRAVIAAEANRRVEDPELLDRYGDYAYVAELTRTQMQIATTPEAGKAAVMAAEWLVSNTGTSEKLAQSADVDERGVPRDLAAFAADVLAAAVASGALAIPPDAVDGAVIEPDAGDDVGDEEGEG